MRYMVHVEVHSDKALQIVASHWSLPTIWVSRSVKIDAHFLKWPNIINMEMYIWIRSSYYSLLEFFYNINSIYNYYFSWEYLIYMWYKINQHWFSPILVHLGSKNKQLSWTNWGLKIPVRPSAHWPTNWKSLVCNLADMIFLKILLYS